MKLPRMFQEKGYYLGPLAIVYSWAAILTAAALNPQWSVTQQALSYLGAYTAHDPWVYNDVAMIPTGTLLAIFSVYLVGISRNRREVLGSLQFTLCALLVVGIGIWHQGPGPYPPGTSPSLGQNLHDLFSAWFFLQAFLGVLTWGSGLRREGRNALGLEMYALALGAVAIADLILVWKGGIPGGTGEVLGILGIDAWVGLLFFAKDATPRTLPTWERWHSTIGSALARLSWARWGPKRAEVREVLQIRAWIYVGLGTVLFYFGFHYLASQLAGLIIAPSQIVLVAARGLNLYLIGFGSVVAGARRWLLVRPSFLTGTWLSVVIVAPLVFVATWFSAGGDTVMIVFFVLVALLLPFAVGLLSLRSRKPGPLQEYGESPEAATPTLSSPAPRRGRKGTATWFVLAFALVVPVVLLATLVPVYTVTRTMDVPCGLYLSLANVETQPNLIWPLIHNFTLPTGEVSMHWWSGSPVWIVVGQIPVGLSYQNTNLNSLLPANQGNLTESGSGSYTSYGGASFVGCAATNERTTVTLVLSYPSPLIWE